MARKSSADVGFLLISGVNVLGQTTQIEDNLDALIEETTVLGDSFEEQAYVGVKRYTLSQQGFYDDTANGANAAMVTPGSSKVLSYAPEGNALGDRFVGSPMVQADYVRQIQRGALTKANASYMSEGQHDEGYIVAPLAARTAASNTQASSFDNGDDSADGGAGYLQMTALTLGGYTNVIVKIQDSADDNTYADLITFTAVTAAPAGERKTVTGQVDQYLAVAWSYTGSGSNPTATWAVGFARN